MPTDNLLRNLKLIHGFRNPFLVFRLRAKLVSLGVLFGSVTVDRSVHPAELWLAVASCKPAHWRQQSQFRREILLARNLYFKFHFSRSTYSLFWVRYSGFRWIC